jgi:hypothetical protein
VLNIPYVLELSLLGFVEVTCAGQLHKQNKLMFVPAFLWVAYTLNWSGILFCLLLLSPSPGGEGTSGLLFPRTDDSFRHLPQSVTSNNLDPRVWGTQSCLVLLFGPSPASSPRPCPSLVLQLPEPELLLVFLTWKSSTEQPFTEHLLMPGTGQASA